jgi:hypothetical protein
MRYSPLLGDDGILIWPEVSIYLDASNLALVLLRCAMRCNNSSFVYLLLVSMWISSVRMPQEKDMLVVQIKRRRRIDSIFRMVETVCC